MLNTRWNGNKISTARAREIFEDAERRGYRYSRELHLRGSWFLTRWTSNLRWPWIVKNIATPYRRFFVLSDPWFIVPRMRSCNDLRYTSFCQFTATSRAVDKNNATMTLGLLREYFTYLPLHQPFLQNPSTSLLSSRPYVTVHLLSCVSITIKTDYSRKASKISKAEPTLQDSLLWGHS